MILLICFENILLQKTNLRIDWKQIPKQAYVLSRECSLTYPVELGRFCGGAYEGVHNKEVKLGVAEGGGFLPAPTGQHLLWGTVSPHLTLQLGHYNV